MEIKFLDRDNFQAYIPELVDLFKLCYKKKVHYYYSAAYFKWRQLYNPFEETLTSVVIEQDRVVASYSGFPCLMNINNKKVMALYALNAATHPDYKGKGYFYRLAKGLTDFAKGKGYKMIIGFPNYNSHRIVVRKLGRKDIYEIPTMMVDLKENKAHLPVTAPTDNEFSLDYEQFASPTDLNSIQKNQAYLKWRYADNPVEDYTNFVVADGKQVTSFMVVKKYMDRLNIIDMQANIPDQCDYLLEQAVNFAHSLKLKAISTWAPRHHYFHTLCEKCGFINNSPVTYFTIKDLSDDRLKISTNYSDWYIQSGDFNAY